MKVIAQYTTKRISMQYKVGYMAQYTTKNTPV